MNMINVLGLLGIAPCYMHGYMHMYTMYMDVFSSCVR